MFRILLFTGLVLLGVAITFTSAKRLTTVALNQHDMDTICDTVVRIPEAENELQWNRDRDRITFVGTSAQYIEAHMRWAIPFVTQTVPNSIWCVMNKKNSPQIVFVSPSNGLSVLRLSDSHVRCYLRFTVMSLDENNLVVDGSDKMNGSVDIAYDVVNMVDDISGTDTDPHILLIECSIH
jgi:hypothetical protein